MYHYYVKENPTDLYCERHQLLVGQAKSARLARKARIKKTQPRRKSSRAVRLVVSLIVTALMAVGLVWVGASGPARASTTFTVNTTADFPDALLDDTVNVCDANISLQGKQCTLRAAIEEANHTVGTDAIHFNMPASGVQTIDVGANGDGQLPVITDQVIMNGYTQPDSSPNTLARGTNALPMIKLNGQSAGAFARGLVVSAPNTVVRGLVINRFSQEGIVVRPETGVRIEGNFIGTDPSGTLDLGNSRDGVQLDGASNSIVGGSTPDKRNLISGNDIDGVFVAFSSTGNKKIQGNLIGTKKDGRNPLGNSLIGVGILSSSNNLVGGASAAEANTIAFNRADGVVVFFKESRANRILRNSIFSNGFDSQEGIDLTPDTVADGSTPNDPGDADRGANGLQNTPSIASTVTSGGKTTIKGSLSTKPDRIFVVRFFSNPADTDEGKTFIGQKKVSTNSDGKVSFTFAPKKAVSAGKTVTATATGSEGTSEFSASTTVTAS
jgi:hypothetical protein